MGNIRVIRDRKDANHLYVSIYAIWINDKQVVELSKVLNRYIERNKLNGQH